MSQKNILTNNELKRTLRTYKRRLQREHIPMMALYLFGSYAKNKQRAWSDVDVAVVSSRFGRDFVEESVYLNRIADEVHPLLQAHPLNPKSLRDPYSTFATEVRRTGKKV